MGLIFTTTLFWLNDRSSFHTTSKLRKACVDNSGLTLFCKSQFIEQQFNSNKGWAACQLSRLLCGYSTSQQCNIFIGCKPRSRISATFRNYTYMYIAISCRGSSGRASALKSWGRGFESHSGQDFSHVCGHFGISGRYWIILPRLRLRRQLQYSTALTQTNDRDSGKFLVF